MYKLLYFSATGNTKVVAELFRDELKSRELSVELINMENKSDIIFSNNDIIGFFYPIYGGGTPINVTKYISELAFKGNEVFIIKTAADYIYPNHSASSTLIKSLKKQNSKPFYDRIIVMASNWLLEYKDDFSKQLYNSAILKTKNAIDEILAKKERFYKNNPIMDLLCKMIHIGESKVGAKFFGKSLCANNDCNMCGLCVQNCPLKNIEEKSGKLKFHSNCLFCMRCIYNCPTRAISSHFFNFVILKNGYNIKKIINNSDLKGTFVTPKTKGFFKHFNDYFDNIEV